MENATNSTRYALIIDDHPLYAYGLAALLLAHKVVDEIHTASSADACQILIERHGNAVITISDFWLAAGTTIELIALLKAKYGVEAVLMISADDDPAVASKARECTKGFLNKQAPNDVFLKAVRCVIAGGTWYINDYSLPLRDAHAREIPITADELGLSPRQAQILAMVLLGQPNKRIAQELRLSESTIKEHITGILQKLAVTNRVEAITKLRGHRLVTH
jgi:DNA-binding NarL/FixJ family response regulator